MAHITEKGLEKFLSYCPDFGLPRSGTNSIIVLCEDMEQHELEALLKDSACGVIEGQGSQDERKKYRSRENPVLALASYIEDHKPMFWSEAVKTAKVLIGVALGH